MLMLWVAHSQLFKCNNRTKIDYLNVISLFNFKAACSHFSGKVLIKIKGDKFNWYLGKWTTLLRNSLIYKAYF